MALVYTNSSRCPVLSVLLPSKLPLMSVALCVSVLRVAFLSHGWFGLSPTACHLNEISVSYRTTVAVLGVSRQWNVHAQT